MINAEGIIELATDLRDRGHRLIDDVVYDYIPGIKESHEDLGIACDVMVERLSPADLGRLLYVLAIAA